MKNMLKKEIRKRIKNGKNEVRLITRKGRRYYKSMESYIKNLSIGFNDISSLSFYRADKREEYLMYMKIWEDMHSDSESINKKITINGIEWDEKKWWIKFRTAKDMGRQCFNLKEVFDSNNKIIKNGRISGNKNHKHKYVLNMSSMTNSIVLQEISKVYTKEFSVKNGFEVNTNQVTISVVNQDCLKKAKEWVDAGIETCVLNMANRKHPGGGVNWGASAQEEELFRRSSYYLAMFPYSYKCAKDSGVKLIKNLYPLNRNYGGVYTSGVTVFRDDADSGYAFLQQPFNVNFIAVAAMRDPECYNGRIADNLVNGVKNKIRTILRIAVKNNQRNLILGALGCGAFHNPPGHVAELFKEILCEEEFLGAFERICFAVMNDHNSNGSSNYDVFKNTLDGFTLPTPEISLNKQ